MSQVSLLTPTATRRRRPAPADAGPPLPLTATSLGDFLAASKAMARPSDPPPNPFPDTPPNIQTTTFTAFKQSSFQEAPPQAGEEFAENHLVGIVLSGDPHKDGLVYNLKTRVFTEADITELLKRHGVSDDDIRQECRLAFADAAAPQAESATPAVAARPAPAVPTVGKALWSNRKDDDKTAALNPAQFVRHVYKAELAAGTLTRADLQADPQLYQAYATWIRRHQGDDLKLPTAPRVRVQTAEEYQERRRTQERISHARRRGFAGH